MAVVVRPWLWPGIERELRETLKWNDGAPKGIDYEDDDSTLRIQSKKIKRCAQIIKFTDYENLKAIIADTKTSIHAIISHSAAREYKEKSQREITEILGGIIQLLQFEIVVNPYSDSPTLFIERFKHLGSDGSGTFGDPIPISKQESIKRFFQELKEFRELDPQNQQPSKIAQNMKIGTSDQFETQLDSDQALKAGNRRPRREGSISHSSSRGVKRGYSGEQADDTCLSPSDGSRSDEASSTKRRTHTGFKSAMKGSSPKRNGGSRRLFVTLGSTKGGRVGAVSLVSKSRGSELHTGGQNEVARSTSHNSSGTSVPPESVDTSRDCILEVQMASNPHASSPTSAQRQLPSSEIPVTRETRGDLSKDSMSKTISGLRAAEDITPSAGLEDPWQGMSRIRRKDILISKNQELILENPDSFLPPKPGSRGLVVSMPLPDLQAYTALIENPTKRPQEIGYARSESSPDQDQEIDSDDDSNEGEEEGEKVDNPSEREDEVSLDSNEWPSSLRISRKSSELPPDSSPGSPQPLEPVIQPACAKIGAELTRLGDRQNFSPRTLISPSCESDVEILGSKHNDIGVSNTSANREVKDFSGSEVIGKYKATDQTPLSAVQTKSKTGTAQLETDYLSRSDSELETAEPNALEEQYLDTGESHILTPSIRGQLQASIIQVERTPFGTTPQRTKGPSVVVRLDCGQKLTDEPRDTSSTQRSENSRSSGIVIPATFASTSNDQHNISQVAQPAKEEVLGSEARDNIGRTNTSSTSITANGGRDLKRNNDEADRILNEPTKRSKIAKHRSWLFSTENAPTRPTAHEIAMAHKRDFLENMEERRLSDEQSASGASNHTSPKNSTGDRLQYPVMAPSATLGSRDDHEDQKDPSLEILPPHASASDPLRRPNTAEDEAVIARQFEQGFSSPATSRSKLVCEESDDLSKVVPRTSWSSETTSVVKELASQVQSPATAANGKTSETPAHLVPPAKAADLDDENPSTTSESAEDELEETTPEHFAPLSPELPSSLSSKEITVSLFDSFQDAYPEYKGKERHFLAMLGKIQTLHQEDRMEHKSLWDDYIIRHQLEYAKYVVECTEQADDPMPYEKFYRDKIDEPMSMKRIVTPAKLSEALPFILDDTANAKKARQEKVFKSSDRDATESVTPIQSTSPRVLLSAPKPTMQTVDLTSEPLPVKLSTVNLPSTPLKTNKRRSLPWQETTNPSSTAASATKPTKRTLPTVRQRPSSGPISRASKSHRTLLTSTQAPITRSPPMAKIKSQTKADNLTALLPTPANPHLLYTKQQPSSTSGTRSTTSATAKPWLDANSPFKVFTRTYLSTQPGRGNGFVNDGKGAVQTAGEKTAVGKGGVFRTKLGQVDVLGWGI